MQIKEKIVMLVFIMFLVAPGLLFALIGGKFDNKNYENRKLAEKPTFSVDSWDKYPKGWDDYLNDNAAFKNQFVRLNSIINLELFKITSSDKVLVGKDKWLFYDNKDDGDCIGCYQGTNKYSDEDLEQIKNNLVNINKMFNKQNKEFVLFIAPNKEQIYSEFMPTNISVVNEERRVDALVNYIRNNTDIKVVYPKDELLKVKEKYQIYNKYDTHWNNVGAFIGTQQITEKLTGKRKYIEEVKVTSDGVSKNDLSIMINLQNYLKEKTQGNISAYNENVKIKEVDESDKVGIRINKYLSDAADKRKIMIIRDSFSEAMFDQFPREFQTTTFIHRLDFYNQILKDENPDIVVYAVVERDTSALIDQVNEICK